MSHKFEIDKPLAVVVSIAILFSSLITGVTGSMAFEGMDDAEMNAGVS